MLDPEILKKAPAKAGVYIFKKKGKPLYIGKARLLKKRLQSYFSGKDKPYLIEKADSLEWIITPNEEEALFLENNLIKSLKPVFNIKLKDDRQYPYLLLTEEEYSALLLERKRNKKGIYIGPFAHSYDLKQFRTIAEEVFGIRTCKKMKKTACMLYQINRCVAPCVKENQKEYKKRVKLFVSFLKGKKKSVLKYIEKEIDRYAQGEMFEYAQRLKERYNIIKNLELSGMHYHYRNSQDVVGISTTGNAVSLVIIIIRNHYIRNVVSMYFFGKESKEESLEKLLFAYYKDQIFLPQSVLLPSFAENMSFSWLEKRGIKIKFSKTGKGKRFLDMAEENAKHYLSIKENILSSLISLQNLLKMKNIPNKIAITDMSHFSGDVPSGVVVFFEKGKPKKEKYRIFHIKEAKGGDDYAMMEETIKRWLNQDIDTDLFVIDGGRGQVNRIKTILREKNPNITIIGIAKPEDKIILEKGGVILLPKYDPVQKLLSKMRDEAHRFAIKQTRTRMRKKLK